VNLTSKLWQNTTMALVCISFIMALMGKEPALRLWLEGWEAIGMFLGLGVGMKMVKDQVDKNAQRKYSRVDNPDGGK